MAVDPSAFSRSGEVQDQWDQRMFGSSLTMIRSPPPPVELAWKMTKAFVRKLFKGKAPRPPTLRTVNPPRGPLLVMLSGGLASLFKYINDIFDVAVKSAKHFACLLLILGSSVYTLCKIYKLFVTNALNIDGKLVLVAAEDAFSHAPARKLLKEICRKPDVECIIPLCVLEKLMAEATMAHSDIRAVASVLMLKDQVRLGTMRVQYSCEEALWMWRVAGIEDFLSYEERIVNSACIYSNLRTDAIVLLVTESEVLRVLAMTKNVKCVQPRQLSKMRIGPHA